MFKSGKNIDNYNPQIFFIIHGQYYFDGDDPKTDYHCHDDLIEISFITSGTVDYLVDNQLYTLKKGQVLINNPGVYHQELLTYNTKSTQVHIGVSNVNLFNNNPNYIDLNNESILTLNKYKDECLKCCDEILSEQNNFSFNYQFMLKSLVMKLLILLTREINEESSLITSSNFSFKSHEKKSIAKNISQYFEENYMNDISLDTLSKNMYLSPVYISKIFKELLGDSPINYLIRIRLSKAKELLETSDHQVKVIAQLVGYNDPYYFSKLFKKYYGISPSKVRRL